MGKVTFFLLISLCLFSLAFGQTKEALYIIPVKGTIDLGLSSFIKRGLSEAKENNAKSIILEIDTFGGRVDAAVEICDYLEEVKPIKTIAFIDDQAWSAGALISLACSEIIMSPGSSIGSAEPRAMGFGQGKNELADEKVVSAIRAKFKAVAEENGHPENLALAFVDKDIEVKKIKLKNEIRLVTEEELEELRSRYKYEDIQIIKTISPRGKLLNLTAKEAKELNLAEDIISSRKQLLELLGLSEGRLIEKHPNWSEVLVRFLTHPMVSPLLLTLGFLGLLFELRMPGWGVSGTLGVLFLSLFFWGHYLAGLANWTEIVIFFIGLALLFMEVFLIPGFGLAGIAGIILLFLGIFLALIKYPLPFPQLQLNRAVYTLSYAVIATFLATMLSLKFIPKSSFWKKIVLSAREKKEEGFKASPSLESYLGRRAKTITSLRPTGRVMIEDKIFDVVSEGGFIDKDKEVQIIKVTGNRIVVKEINYA